MATAQNLYPAFPPQDHFQGMESLYGYYPPGECFGFFWHFSLFFQE